jgi:hypothetical protein
MQTMRGETRLRWAFCDSSHSVKLRRRQGSDEAMRLMGILLIVLIALWAVQGQRHHCYFGLNATYVHCLLGRGG